MCCKYFCILFNVAAFALWPIIFSYRVVNDFNGLFIYNLNLQVFPNFYFLVSYNSYFNLSSSSFYYYYYYSYHHRHRHHCIKIIITVVVVVVVVIQI